MEEQVGVITHFFSKIGVASIELSAPLAVGDRIHIKGATTNFIQHVDSMQIEGENIDKAEAGQEIGIKAKEKVRGHDLVYKITD